MTLWVGATQGKSRPCQIWQPYPLRQWRCTFFSRDLTRFVIKRSCDFMDGSISLQARTLPSFMVIVITVVANSEKLVCKTSKQEKKMFLIICTILCTKILQQLQGHTPKKAELKLFSKNFAACFSESITTIFSSLGGKWLVFYFCIIFPLAL